ncbi:uncharacterized protein LOC136081822 isoform X2 [Hydra vulgaris]|uniref:Uncharacterized protein LOC136081822 isoform X2 n=1 Tax=Hydra vulgaris TaxID=6087 RepID=A0ABM4C3J5_HYDVU
MLQSDIRLIKDINLNLTLTMKQFLVLLLMIVSAYANLKKMLKDANSSSDSRWKLLKKEACYQAKGDLPANIEINQNGILIAVKLVYINGIVKCHSSFSGSYFGCFTDQTLFNLAISDKNRVVLFPPPNQAITYDGYKNYKYPGYLPNDKEVVFTNYDYPTYFKTGDRILIWNYEDLNNSNEGDNSGQVCMDVYGAFV